MIILPSLHTKLGLFKNFVKVLDKNGAGFQYLKETIPRVSDSKIKEGIFVGPQRRAMIWDGNFEDLLSRIEKSAWKSFKSVVKIFLGNRKSPNYHEIVGELLQSYQDMGCNMFLKIHFFDSHLDFFPDNPGAVRGKELPGIEKCKNACWLLLDDEEGCFRCQAQKSINNPHIFSKVNNVCSM